MLNQQRVRAAGAVYRLPGLDFKIFKVLVVSFIWFLSCLQQFSKHSFTQNFFITKPWTFGANLHYEGDEPFIYSGMFVNNPCITLYQSNIPVAIFGNNQNNFIYCQISIRHTIILIGKYCYN